MKIKIEKKRVFQLAIMLILTLAFICVANNVQAQPAETPKCDTTKFKEISGVCFPLNTGLEETDVTKIVSNILFWIIGIFGMLALLAFIISGIQYLVSAGEEKTLETAKRNMKWSLVGVVIGLSGMVVIKAISAALKATLQ